jgi:hypothetical protein
LVFGAWDLGFGGDGHWGGGALIPRYIRYIDKMKVVAIMNPSYFGRLPDLPIDKIDIIVLKY